MEWLAIILVATMVVCMSVGILVLGAFVNKKMKQSLSQIPTNVQVANTQHIVENSMLNHIRKELRDVKEGLEKYKEESQYWYQAYKVECKEREILQEEVKTIKREVGILRKIVDKMDGREIVRDENRNIQHIRVVK